MSSPLSAIVVGLREGAAARTVDGIAATVDELRPGMRVTLGYGQLGSAGLVRLAGHVVTFSDGSLTVTREVPWLLPDVALSPGEPYIVWLSGDSLEVAPGG